MGLITYGKITKRHGLSGEVKVLPFSRDFNSLNNLKQVYIKLNNKAVEFKIIHKKFQKNTAIVKFEGINSPEDADKLVNCELLVEKSHLAELEENEYYWFQLIGLEVFTEKNKYVGKVMDIIDNGAQEILVVEAGKNEVLIPFVEKFVIETNINKSKIVVNTIEGLLDVWPK